MVIAYSTLVFESPVPGSRTAPVCLFTVYIPPTQVLTASCKQYRLAPSVSSFLHYPLPTSQHYLSASTSFTKSKTPQLTVYGYCYCHRKDFELTIQRLSGAMHLRHGILICFYDLQMTYRPCLYTVALNIKMSRSI